MQFLERFLLTLVLLGTLVVGGALFYGVSFQQGVALDTPKSPVPLERTVLPEQPSVISGFLSKLSLFPFIGRGERSLVAVIVENHEQARLYHQGLRDAVLIQEYLVEGLISRFVVFFDVRRLPIQVGPVRSLRPYFLDGALPITHVIYHAGGSPEALERAQNDSAITALNGLYYSDHFLRADNIPAPHNLFIVKDRIEDLLPENLTTTLWPPYETGTVRSGERARVIHVNFHNPVHDVLYEYQVTSRRYIRTNGGIVSEAQPRNVLILEVPINGEGEFGRLDITVRGQGRVLLFQSGVVIPGRWRKAGEESPFVFEDANGDPLRFASGLTWMTVLPTLERVTWIEEEL